MQASVLETFHLAIKASTEGEVDTFKVVVIVVLLVVVIGRIYASVFHPEWKEQAEEAKRFKCKACGSTSLTQISRTRHKPEWPRDDIRKAYAQFICDKCGWTTFAERDNTKRDAQWKARLMAPEWWY